MKNDAIVGDIGQLDNEIDMECFEAMNVANIKSRWTVSFSPWSRVIVLASGRLLILGDVVLFHEPGACSA